MIKLTFLLISFLFSVSLNAQNCEDYKFEKALNSKEIIGWKRCLDGNSCKITIFASFVGQYYFVATTTDNKKIYFDERSHERNGKEIEVYFPDIWIAKLKMIKRK